jgi:hypothetical protein
MTPQQKIVEEKMTSAKDYAETMLLKAKDQTQKFLNHSPMCQLCLGTGSRIIYKYGTRFAKRCEAATWDAEKKRLVCAGNSNWQELETDNKKDLSSEIWKIVVREKLKEPFMFFLKEDYKTDKLANLLIQQLYTILCMLRSGRLLTVLSSTNQQSEAQKAA